MGIFAAAITSSLVTFWKQQPTSIDEMKILVVRYQTCFLPGQFSWELQYYAVVQIWKPTFPGRNKTAVCMLLHFNNPLKILNLKELVLIIMEAVTNPEIIRYLLISGPFEKSELLIYPKRYPNGYYFRVLSFLG